MTDPVEHAQAPQPMAGWWGGLPIPPGVGDNTGWAPPAQWDPDIGGLVDQDGNPVIPTDPPPETYPPDVIVVPPPQTNPEPSLPPDTADPTPDGNDAQP
ncbi:hypothetical protein ABT324_24360 [Saccharopolyspora sp. NPDC000359]|uniref:hypothetical protein n=1 Tax=Saccharopolyspora sp. NPDC000359 TaxID=3154251 RepID=UPI003322DC89